MKSLATPAVVNTISAAFWIGPSLRASGLFKMVHLGQSLVNFYQASGQVTNEGTVTLQSMCGLGRGVRIPKAGCQLGDSQGDRAMVSPHTNSMLDSLGFPNKGRQTLLFRKGFILLPISGLSTRMKSNLNMGKTGAFSFAC